MLRMRVSENLGQIFLRNHPCLPSPARASQNISCLPSGCSAPCQGRWEGLSPIPPAWSPAQRNEWCSTLQKKVMEQRLVGSRPRPANTAHCQKSGTLELKGHKSKVFAALSLPEMWLYKSEQVRGPTGMRGMEGAEPGLVLRGEQVGRKKGMAEQGAGDPAQGSSDGDQEWSPTKSSSPPSNYHHFGLGHTKHPNPSQDSRIDGHRITHTCCRGAGSDSWSLSPPTLQNASLPSC